MIRPETPAGPAAARYPSSYGSARAGLGWVRPHGLTACVTDGHNVRPAVLQIRLTLLKGGIYHPHTFLKRFRKALGEREEAEMRPLLGGVAGSYYSVSISHPSGLSAFRSFMFSCRSTSRSSFCSQCKP